MPDTDDKPEIIGIAPSGKTAALTEREILDCLKSNLKLAASCARQLSRGERGPIYPRFREAIDLIYGCCRQMSGWREDLRWGQFGMMIHECRERCRRWLVEKHGPRMFRKLAENLDNAFKQATDLETKRTGRIGALLPAVLTPETRTQDRPVSMSGLILPPGFKRDAESVH